MKVVVWRERRSLLSGALYSQFLWTLALSIVAPRFMMTSESNAIAEISVVLGSWLIFDVYLWMRAPVTSQLNGFVGRLRAAAKTVACAFAAPFFHVLFVLPRVLS
jgi:hypothetical protein